MSDFAEKISPDHTVLLVVDVQNDYCHLEGLLGKKGNDVSAVPAAVGRINDLIAAAHEVGTKVIFVRTTHDEWTNSPARTALAEAEFGIVSNDICRTGTWGAEYYEVAPGPEDYVITKHRYSAFIGTPLDLVLRATRTRTLIVTGVAAHVCVESTIRDAFMYDYEVVLPADCTDTVNADPQLLETTFANLHGRFAEVTTAEAIEHAWAGNKSGKHHKESKNDDTL